MNAPLGLKSVDKGYNIIKRRYAVGRNLIKVGIQGIAGAKLVMVGTWNEFGTAHIPQRSFIRAAIDEHREELKEYAHELLKEYLNKGDDIAHYLGRLGEKTQALIQKKIQSGVPPPNAPATIKRKGSSKTLIDTGALLHSIRWALVSKGGHEGHEEHAGHEHGGHE